MRPASPVARVSTLAVILAAAGGVATAQPRALSPRGQASTQVGGHFDADGAYRNGKWIDITYGRPILRGRTDPFGGDPYGGRVLSGAPVWRLGADQSTRLRTEVNLIVGDDRLPAGEYSLFIDLQPGAWTLVVSSYGVKQWYLEQVPDALFGAFDYTTDHDVLRAPMTLRDFPVAADQLIIAFTDMTQQGGALSIWWDRRFATVPFTVAP